MLAQRFAAIIFARYRGMISGARDTEDLDFIAEMLAEDDERGTFPDGELPQLRKMLEERRQEIKKAAAGGTNSSDGNG